MNELYVRNRQRTRRIDTQLVKSLATALMEKSCPGKFRIGIVLVGDREMARLNEAYLAHAGPTDVLAFGYTSAGCESLEGEVFVCVDEGLRQARRFATTWQQEIARYVIHGLLHLQGCEDSTPAARKEMKRLETRFLKELARQFNLAKLSRAG